MALKPVKGKAGVFVTSDGQTIKIVEWREDDKYDTVDFAAGAISAGQSKEFFRDLTDKNLIDTNLTTPRRIAGGQNMIIDRIGVQIPTAVGDDVVLPSDIKKVAEAGALDFRINDILIAQGPAVKFPSGYGVQGQTTETNAGVVGIGVPSTAAQSRLTKEQTVTPQNDLNAVMKFDDRKWRSGGATAMPTLSGVVFVRLFAHGLIQVAATKG